MEFTWFSLYFSGKHTIFSDELPALLLRAHHGLLPTPAHKLEETKKARGN